MSRSAWRLVIGTQVIIRAPTILLSATKMHHHCPTDLVSLACAGESAIAAAVVQSVGLGRVMGGWFAAAADEGSLGGISI